MALLAFGLAGTQAAFARPGARALVGAIGVAFAILLLGGFVAWRAGTLDMRVGGAAEEWTDGELGRLRRRGYEVVNDFVVPHNYQIDHVVIGPGGVFVIETKWSGSGWSDHILRERVARGSKQALAGSRCLGLGFAPHVGIAREQIHALVVLWGHGAREAVQRNSETVAFQSVPVVTGPHLAEWILSHDQSQLGPDEIGALARSFEEYQVEVRDHLRRIERRRQ